LAANVSETPSRVSTRRQGPVPIGAAIPSAVVPPAFMAAEETKRNGRGSESSFSVGACGASSTRRKASGPVTSVRSIRRTRSSQAWRARLARIASKFAFTAGASKGVPSLKVTPGRRVKS
jgi:hypothetical protein